MPSVLKIFRNTSMMLLYINPFPVEETPWLYILVETTSKGVIATTTKMLANILEVIGIMILLLSNTPHEDINSFDFEKDDNWLADPTLTLNIPAVAPRHNPTIPCFTKISLNVLKPPLILCCVPTAIAALAFAWSWVFT